MWSVFPARQYRTLVLIAVAVGLAACADASTLSSVGPDIAVSAGKSAAQTASIEEFAQEQGYYCNPDPNAPLTCVGLPVGLGWILSIGREPNPAVMYTVDLGNVNRNYWALTEPDAGLAPYSVSGTVSESRLNDGRRRLIINIRVQNTATELFNSDNINVLGRYAPFDGPDVATMLANINAHIDLVLPADFVGIPDVMQVIFDPLPGMELRHYNVRVEGEGELRVPYNGMEEGTLVRMVAHSNAMPKLALKGVRSERLIMLNYDPTSRITVTAVK